MFTLISKHFEFYSEYCFRERQQLQKKYLDGSQLKIVMKMLRSFITFRD